MMAYQSKVTSGAMVAYRQEMAFVADPVDLSGVIGIEVGFENVESVLLSAEVVQSLLLTPVWQNPAGEMVVDGFWLSLERKNCGQDPVTWGRFNQDESGLSRIRQYQDVTSITIRRADGKSFYWVEWDVLSEDDAVNLAQHYSESSTKLNVWALPQATHNLSEIALVAQEPMRTRAIIADLVCGLAEDDGTEWDESKLEPLIDATLAELVSFAGLAKHNSQCHLIVRRTSTSVNGDSVDWDPIMHDDRTNEDYAGLGLTSYQELLGMDVQVEGPDFWSGIAWLLWEICYTGAEANERAENIRQFYYDLEGQEKDFADFEAETDKMKRFLDWYVTQHLDDNHLADMVAKYWPLTEGRKEQMFTESEAPMTATIAEQDLQLKREFLLEFGPEYKAFK